MDEKPGVINKPRLMVVDDDPVVLKFLIDVLAPGYHLFTANNGAEVLQQLKDFKGQVDLLLTDFEMPGLNGIELATQVTKERPEIKVLLMSGFTGGMLVLNEGWHYLPKPFIASALRALVDGLIAPRKSKFTAANIQP